MSSGDVGSSEWMEALMNAVERGTPPVPLAPPARDLTNPERRGLCIGCWYAECSGQHVDPDLACDCCMGRVQTR